jgi:hypothetical protein
MRLAAALLLTLVALAGCNKDKDDDTTPAGQPAPASEQAPGSGSDIVPGDRDSETTKTGE